MAKRIAILTSGGDAPGMNAVIRAVVRKGLHHQMEIYGIERGYEGLIAGQFLPLAIGSVGGVIQRGGTMLKTARSEVFKTAPGFELATKNLRRWEIDCLIVVGGDGSMAGAVKLSQAGFNTIVIPATIDNDMPGTEYAIGYDTALNTVLDAVNKIRDTAVSNERVAVVEVMGRNSGHIALMAGLACGAEVILLPERPLNMDEVCHTLLRSQQRGKLYSIVVVAEGVAKGYEIAGTIARQTSFKPHVTVLGYIQRGGSPSAADNIMGSRMGSLAVDCILKETVNTLIASWDGGLKPLPFDQAVKNTKELDLSLYELAGILAM